MTARNLSSDIPRMEKVKIRAIYYAPNNRRRDMSNLFPTVKSAVDGLVDAGVLKDDTDRYVVSMEMLRGEGVVTGGQIIIEVIDVGDSV